MAASNFDTGPPAWRIKRFRQHLREAFDRGLDMEDDSQGLEHPAELRRFNAARADIFGEIRRRLSTAMDGLLDGTLTLDEAKLLNKKNGQLLRACKRELRRRRLSSSR